MELTPEEREELFGAPEDTRHRFVRRDNWQFNYLYLIRCGHCDKPWLMPEHQQKLTCPYCGWHDKVARFKEVAKSD